MNSIHGRGEDEIMQAPRIQKPVSVRPKQPPMPKAKALALVQELKRGLVVASILCFGSLGGLILSHTSITAAQTTTKQATSQIATTTTTTPTPTSSKTTAASSSAATSSSKQGGGYGFGTSSSTSTPVSGSSAS